MQHEVFGWRQVIPSRSAFFFVLINTSLIAMGCGASPHEGSVVVSIGAEPSTFIEVATAANAPQAEPILTKPTSIRWETSDDEARSRARKRRSPLVVFLFAAWVAASSAMDRTTWADPKIAEALAPLVSVRVDLTNADSQAEALSLRYNTRMLPTTVIFDERGTEIARFEGYSGAEPILKLLATVPPPEN